MSEKYKGVYVAFGQDLDEDRTFEVMAAIRMLRGVTGVERIEAGAATDWIARKRIAAEIGAEFSRLWDFVLTGKRPEGGDR